MRTRETFLKLFFLLIASVFVPQESPSQIHAWRKAFGGPGLSVAINPLNPNTIYAETFGSKLYVSRNLGTTWSALGSPGINQIRQILVHPNDTLTLFCARFSGDLRKSTDEGVTWKSVISPYTIDGEALSYDPVHPDTMFAGDYAGIVYKSTDRGETWFLLGELNSSLCAFAIRPDSTDIIYAGTGGGRISKSTDAGSTWKTVRELPGSGQEIPKIEIDLANPAVAYASAFGGLTDSLRYVLKTTDGGEHWFNTSLQSQPIWSLAIDQSDPQIVYAGKFYGIGKNTLEVYRTTDGGTSWTGLDFRPLLPLDSWNLKVSSLNPDFVWMAASDYTLQTNGIYRWSGTQTGIQGAVIDSISGDTVSNGFIKNYYTLDSVGLASTQGFYQFGFFPGDPAPAPFLIEAYPYYAREITMGFVNDTIITNDILLTRLGVGAISGAVADSTLHEPVQSRIALFVTTLVGHDTLYAATDTSGGFSFDNLYVSQTSINSYDSIVVIPVAPYAGETIRGLNVTTSGLALQFSVLIADVFLVGAPGSGDYDIFYMNALRANGVTASAWNTSTFGLPSFQQTTVFNKKILIYYSGGRHSAFSQEELDSLTSCIQAGGNIFLTGQDIVEKNDSSDLIRNVIGVRFAGGSFSKYVHGTTGTIFEPDEIYLTGPNGDHQTSMDVITPVDPLVKTLMGYGDQGRVVAAGVRKHFLGTANNIVLTGFGFEAMTYASASNHVMQGVLTTLLSPSADFSLSVDQSWNLVSLPLKLIDSLKTVIFPAANSSAFSYDGTYDAQAILRRGIGYWLKFPTSRVISLPPGDIISAETLAVQAGWNLIGGVTQPVSAGSIIQIPANNILGPLYTYHHGYVLADSVMPGTGYWVNAGSSGQLIIGAPAGESPAANPLIGFPGEANRLHFRDNEGNEQALYFGSEQNFPSSMKPSGMPPSAPENLPDIRFASNSLMSIYPEPSDRPVSFPITIRNAVYPLKVTCRISSLERHRLVLEEILGDRRHTHVLDGETTLSLRDPETTQLILRVEPGSASPTSIVLYQNYPNPFNPKTDLRFEVGDWSLVNLKIFDVLGREVATVVKEWKAPGYYSVSWDAGNFPSGVYFYRLEAGKFTDVKKLTLIR